MRRTLSPQQGRSLPGGPLASGSELSTSSRRSASRPRSPEARQPLAERPAANATGQPPTGSREIGSPAPVAEPPQLDLEATQAGPVPGIDRTNLTWADNRALDALGLDHLPPGGQNRLQIEATGELSAVLGVEVGGNLDLAISRGQGPGQDQFTIGLGGGLQAGAELTADTAGVEANAGLGLGLGAGIELQLDLSQEGAATQLGGFALQAGAASANPLVAQGLELADRASDFVFGRDVTPGTPSEFIGDHISAVTVGGSGQLSSELGAILGAGGVLNLEGQLAAGARLTIGRDNGQPYVSGLTRNITAAANAELEGGLGALGFNATSNVLGAGASLGFEQSTAFRPDGSITGTSYAAILGAQANGGLGPVNSGYDGSVRLQLDERIPQEARADLVQALRGGDLSTARQIFDQEVIPNASLQGSLQLNTQTRLNGELALTPSLLGVGGGITAEGTLTRQRSLLGGEITLRHDGITAQLAGPNGQSLGTLTFQNVQELQDFFQQTASPELALDNLPLPGF